MPKISVVVIAYNEERNIERCIKSVLPVADEILVVDSFSTDKTETICNAYHVRFVQHVFEGYIEQKNWAIEQADNDHILSLDADEELSEDLKNSILKVKANWKYDGYYFNRLTYYCGKWIKHTSWYPARKLRLWDRRKGHWEGINPHDTFMMVKGSKIKFIEGDLRHYSFYTISDQIRQINKFSDILAQSYHQRGMNSNYWHIISHPLWRFFRDYILKLGFLDGFYGLVVSINASFEVFLKYIKLKKINDCELLSEPFRICIHFSSNQLQEEAWQYNYSRFNQENGIEPVIVTDSLSTLSQRTKSAKYHFYKCNLNRYSILNLIKVIKLYRFYKRQRVKEIVVADPNILKAVTFCANLAGIKNIIYYQKNVAVLPSSIVNQFIFNKFVSEVIINSSKLKYPNLMYNYKLFSKEKIHVMNLFNGLSAAEVFDKAN
jgi:glycosyltransferase involved in cell wall biosynthesis